MFDTTTVENFFPHCGKRGSRGRSAPGRCGRVADETDDFFGELGVAVVEGQDMAGGMDFGKLGRGGVGGGEEELGGGGVHDLVGGGNGDEERPAPVGGAGPNGVDGVEQGAVDVAVDVFVGPIGGAGVGIAEVLGKARFDDVGENEEAVEEVEPLAGREEGAAGAGNVDEWGEQDEAGHAVFGAEGGIVGEGAAEGMAYEPNGPGWIRGAQGGDFAIDVGAPIGEGEAFHVGEGDAGAGEVHGADGETGRGERRGDLGEDGRTIGEAMDEKEGRGAGGIEREGRGGGADGARRGGADADPVRVERVAGEPKGDEEEEKARREQRDSKAEGGGHGGARGVIRW